jgi:hypothetical protein
LEFVRAADGIENGLTRLETEVVGVVEAQTAADVLELLRGYTFERGLGCDGHEEGGLDGAMWEGEDGCASFGGLQTEHQY